MAPSNHSIFKPSRLAFKHFVSFKKPGTPPGTVRYMGQKRAKEVLFHLHDYNQGQIKEFHASSFNDCITYFESPSVTWLEVKGLHDIEKLQPVWDHFQIHPLIQEDIANTRQRPKIEQYQNCTFIVMQMLYQPPESDLLESEQISIILGPNYILSFQESNKPLFDGVIQRMARPKRRKQPASPDYIAYALIDTIVDHYFNLVGIIGERIDQLEEALMDDPDQSILKDIHRLHKEIIYSRKAIWPTQELLSNILKKESAVIKKATKVFLRDVDDHISHITDMVENYRDMIISMHDIYMSQASNKMNEVMKVLTIIATIFIPLTFIAGIYGMNFNPEASPYSMPELNWYWGYPAAWALMLGITLIMVVYFKRKGWF